MADIDRLSRRVPVLCKVAPCVADVHLEDVHRAGGVMAILGELDRAGLLDTAISDRASADAGRRRWTNGTSRAANDEACANFYRAAPGGVPTQEAFSQCRRYDELDLDRANGAIRDATMPSARTAASRFCTATSRWTAAS